MRQLLIKFVILNTKLHFTCSESDLYFKYCEVLKYYEQDCTVQKTTVKPASTDMWYFAGKKFSRGLVLKKNWLDMKSSLHVRILTLSNKVGYFFWVWMNSGKIHERQSFSVILKTSHSLNLIRLWIFSLMDFFPSL